MGPEPHIPGKPPPHVFFCSDQKVQPLLLDTPFWQSCLSVHSQKFACGPGTTKQGADEIGKALESGTGEQSTPKPTVEMLEKWFWAWRGFYDLPRMIRNRYKQFSMWEQRVLSS